MSDIDRRTRSLRRGVGSLLLFLLVAVSANAQVPTAVPFQGILLDSGGAPVSASVDLDFELFDALVDGGSLWSESHAGVVVVDGIYSVDLGTTVPLGPSVIASGAAFLEITVSGETLVPRQQLLSVPYAIHAGTSSSSSALNGVSGGYFEELVRSFPLDGQDPPNEHPDEGLGDSDLDGIANFIDPDNDDDGILDGEELVLGTNINVVDAAVNSVTPDQVTSFAPTTLHVTGSGFNFLSGVSFAGAAATAYNVTLTEFDIDVLTETPDATGQVAVQLSGGQTANSSDLVLNKVAPTITTSPLSADATTTEVIEILGTGFYPGTIVQIGSQTLMPTSLTETSITVTMAPEPEGFTTIDVIHPNTLVASAPLTVVDGGAAARVVFVSTTTNGNIGSLAAADAICQADAVAAGLPPALYQAWLSDGTDSPSTRMNQVSGPFELPDGTQIALSWADLTGGTLSAPINLRANGNAGVGLSVFTGTTSSGTYTGAETSCSDWTSTSGSARVGSTSATNGDWTDDGSTRACSFLTHLYCVAN